MEIANNSASVSNRKARICFVGPMLGCYPGWVPNPAEALAPRLEAAGYACRLTSPVLNRYLRLVDIYRSLVAWRKWTEILYLQVYSGQSFVVEDLVSWLGCRLGFKIIMVLHGGALPRFMSRYPDWARRMMMRADLIVAPSSYLSRAVALLGFQARVIPNLLDLEDYPYWLRSQVRPNLIWMRTFHELYNPKMALRVLKTSCEHYPEISLTMAGQERGLIVEVKRLARELDLENKVRFVGFLDKPAKKREFAAHDIFLNTNHVDNMPISVLEAAAFGLPIVATAVGGVPDLLTDEVTGLLVPDNDYATMAQSVQRLLDDPGLAECLSRNGRDLAEQSAWSRVYPLWEQAFSDV